MNAGLVNSPRASYGSKRTISACMYAIARLSQARFSRIVTNTPVSYGAHELLHRYKQSNSTLMRDHVRLQAEREGVALGHRITLY